MKYWENFAKAYAAVLGLGSGDSPPMSITKDEYIDKFSDPNVGDNWMSRPKAIEISTENITRFMSPAASVRESVSNFNIRVMQLSENVQSGIQLNDVASWGSRMARDTYGSKPKIALIPFNADGPILWNNAQDATHFKIVVVFKRSGITVLGRGSNMSAAKQIRVIEYGRNLGDVRPDTYYDISTQGNIESWAGHNEDTLNSVIRQIESDPSIYNFYKENPPDSFYKQRGDNPWNYTPDRVIPAMGGNPINSGIPLADSNIDRIDSVGQATLTRNAAARIATGTTERERNAMLLASRQQNQEQAKNYTMGAVDNSDSLGNIFRDPSGLE